MMKSPIAATVAAALALMLPIAPASAQMARPQHEQKKPPPKPKVDEKAYKSALDKIPDAKTKADPWSNTR